MEITEFMKKKYGGAFTEQKKAIREFKQNQKDRKRYSLLKRKGFTHTHEFSMLQKNIIW